MNALLSVIAVAMAAQPAPPVEVGHVGLGSSLEALVAGPDGGAWVGVSRFVDGMDRGQDSWDDAIARATPDGRFQLAAIEGALSLADGALGPDGQAWYQGGLSLHRSDAAGSVTRLELEQPIGDVVATGPDGTLWAAEARTRTLSRLDAQGAITRSRLALPACKPLVQFEDMKPATDGAVWIADGGCGRLIRIAPGRAPTVVALDSDERPFALAPDRARRSPCGGSPSTPPAACGSPAPRGWSTPRRRT